MALTDDDKHWIAEQLESRRKSLTMRISDLVPPAKPSIGRIVHFRLDHTEAELVPAVITAVESESAVTLVLVSDVPSLNGRACRHVERGDDVGQWNWPHKV